MEETPSKRKRTFSLYKESNGDEGWRGLCVFGLFEIQPVRPWYSLTLLESSGLGLIPSDLFASNVNSKQDETSGEREMHITTARRLGIPLYYLGIPQILHIFIKLHGIPM